MHWELYFFHVLELVLALQLVFFGQMLVYGAEQLGRRLEDCVQSEQPLVFVLNLQRVQSVIYLLLIAERRDRALVGVGQRVHALEVELLKELLILTAQLLRVVRVFIVSIVRLRHLYDKVL